MPIPADTSDLMWVLQRACPECGFEAGAVSVPELPRMIAANAAEWAPILARPDVRERPDHATWSPLEYAAHVRDVYRLFTGRLQLMLSDQDPVFEDWDQDASAVQQRYDLQDPAVVGRELAEAAAGLAEAFEAVAPQAYQRTGRRCDGAVFTVQTLGQYGVHEAVHHLWDVSHD